MQSSGATAFTLFLAQRPDCLALVDVLNNFAAPRVNTTMDMVLKVTMTTAYPLAVHMECFRPDRVILLRDPHDNYQSLKTKHYRNYSGLLDEKFMILDQVFAERDHFDAVIRYEDFVARDPLIISTLSNLGWSANDSFIAISDVMKSCLERYGNRCPTCSIGWRLTLVMCRDWKYPKNTGINRAIRRLKSVCKFYVRAYWLITAKCLRFNARYSALLNCIVMWVGHVVYAQPILYETFATNSASFRSSK